jgi:hypothetical protein
MQASRRAGARAGRHAVRADQVRAAPCHVTGGAQRGAQSQAPGGLNRSAPPHNVSLPSPPLVPHTAARATTWPLSQAC